MHRATIWRDETSFPVKTNVKSVDCLVTHLSLMLLPSASRRSPMLIRRPRHVLQEIRAEIKESRSRKVKGLLHVCEVEKPVIERFGVML
jgi:hypothetical protein